MWRKILIKICKSIDFSCILNLLWLFYFSIKLFYNIFCAFWIYTSCVCVCVVWLISIAKLVLTFYTLLTLKSTDLEYKIGFWFIYFYDWFQTSLAQHSSACTKWLFPIALGLTVYYRPPEGSMLLPSHGGRWTVYRTIAASRNFSAVLGKTPRKY